MENEDILAIIGITLIAGVALGVAMQEYKYESLTINANIKYQDGLIQGAKIANEQCKTQLNESRELCKIKVLEAFKTGIDYMNVSTRCILMEE